MSKYNANRFINLRNILENSNHYFHLSKNNKDNLITKIFRPILQSSFYKYRENKTRMPKYYFVIIILT